MLDHNGIGSCQPESTPLSFCCEIGVKDVGEHFFGYATAGVLYSDFDISALWKGKRNARREYDILCLHLHRAAARHGLHGIQDDVVDDLVNLSRIDIHRPEICGNLEIAPHIGPSQDKANTLLEEFDKRDGVPHRGTAFSKGEELLGKRSGLLTRL